MRQPCTPGSTDCVHGGVQSVYIRVEMRFVHQQILVILGDTW